MYCPSCGAWNPDDSRFCGKCGRPIQSVTGGPSPEGWRDSASRFGGGGAQPSRSSLCLIVLMASILVALGAVAVGVFVLRDQLSSIWPRPAVSPTSIVSSPSPSATSVPVGATATPLPSASLTGAAQSPTAPPAATATPKPTQSPAPLPTSTPRPRVFKLVYRGCTPHAQSLGSVKGQVFDKKGAVIPGAKVRITIDGYDWKSDANPATTNGDGWYEWILQVGQTVKFVELVVGGQPVSFSPTDLEVKATGGCFQRVDFIEQ
jgi:hypothetical protein